VDAKKLFLLDSGAQYVDGTTDVTRTVHFGEPTARQKECFTRVLQVAEFYFFFLKIL
jgi:Xaa-Pro aminopeptidase